MSHYERKETLTLDEVFPHVGKGIVYINGDKIYMTSLRYETFLNSCKCVSCGIEGTFFAKERATKGIKREVYHLNLYAIKNGAEILMTKDHIVPLSLGGTDTPDNLQTMCKKCNEKKGNGYRYHLGQILRVEGGYLKICGRQGKLYSVAKIRYYNQKRKLGDVFVLPEEELERLSNQTKKIRSLFKLGQKIRLKDIWVEIVEILEDIYVLSDSRRFTKSELVELIKLANR